MNLEVGKRLWNAKSGRAAISATEKLLAALRKNPTGTEAQVLAEYVLKGTYEHVKEFILGRLAKEGLTLSPFGEIADRCLENPDLRFWAIPVFLNSVGGASALARVAALAHDARLPVGDRAQAVKCLSRCAQMQFDRCLPSDPEFWSEADLRLDELRQWERSVFPFGNGYAPLARDSALDLPKTKLEAAAAALERRLQELRGTREDPANPSNRLVPAANANDVEELRGRWSLSAEYAEFLRRFNPHRVLIEGKEFTTGLELVGLDEFESVQRTYRADGFPEQYLVVATDNADPFSLRAGEGESPVFFAHHDVKPWELTRFKPGFIAFLESLASE